MRDWVKVGAYMYRYEAELAAGKLDAEGIDFIITEEMSSTTQNYFPVIPGGCCVLVDRADEINALEILKTEGSADLAALSGSGTDDGVIECPACGSKNVSTRRWSAVGFVFGVLLLGIPFIFYDTRRFCFDCGRKFGVRKS